MYLGSYVSLFLEKLPPDHLIVGYSSGFWSCFWFPPLALAYFISHCLLIAWALPAPWPWSSSSSLYCWLSLMKSSRPELASIRDTPTHDQLTSSFRCIKKGGFRIFCTSSGRTAFVILLLGHSDYYSTVIRNNSLPSSSSGCPCIIPVFHCLTLSTAWKTSNMLF